MKGPHSDSYKERYEPKQAYLASAIILLHMILQLFSWHHQSSRRRMRIL
jgi:hypothetical protein